MTVFARRYHWSEAHPFDNTLILDGFVAHPEFLTYPYDESIRRQIGAHMLTDPSNIVYLTYSDSELTGIVIFTRVQPRVDALMHFLFLDRDLASKRKLLNNLIGVAFTDFGLNRLSMEVPEGIRLERFARKCLGFRFEGENLPRNPELPKSLADNWVAKQGSRRQMSYFNGEKWSDILLLRLLASEWVGEQGEVESCRYQQSSGQPPQSSADSLEKP